MNLLIKNMEMPTTCLMCPLSALYEKPRDMLRCKITKEEVIWDKIDRDCPLIELPLPGRSIEAEGEE